MKERQAPRISANTYEFTILATEKDLLTNCKNTYCIKKMTVRTVTLPSRGAVATGDEFLQSMNHKQCQSSTIKNNRLYRTVVAGDQKVIRKPRFVFQMLFR